MAEFGAFQVNRACRHAFGHLEMELEPGRYEPTSPEEFVAMEHLASVPVATGPDGEPGEPFAVKLENPAGAPEGETGVVRPVFAEPDLPEPPAPAAQPEPALPEPPPATEPNEE